MMPDPDFLRASKIAVLGLGLMGGSFAMAVQPYCQAVYGYDPDPIASSEAWNSGIFYAVSDNPELWLNQVDYIVLAAPINGILNLITRLPGWHPGKVMVLDLGSTKEDIVGAMQSLPERFDPMGGHPMCGKETSSFKNAEAKLFEGHPFILTPLERTTQQMHQATVELVERIGAYPLYLDAQTHDLWVSATSHVPHLVANCLAAVTPTDAAPLIGPGFRSSARLAATSSRILLDILQTNRSNILTQITAFEEKLRLIKMLLEGQEYEKLDEVLLQGANHYYELIRQRGN
jgi:prephenate dehydrogenase